LDTASCPNEWWDVCVKRDGAVAGKSGEDVPEISGRQQWNQ